MVVKKDSEYDKIALLGRYDRGVMKEDETWTQEDSR